MNSLPRFDAKAYVLYQENWSSDPSEEFPRAAVHVSLISWSIGEAHKNDLDHTVLTISEVRRDDCKDTVRILHSGWADYNKIADLTRTAMLEFSIAKMTAKKEIGA